MKALRVTKEARALLVELGQRFETYDRQTESLSNRSLDQHMAVEVGAERELTKTIILGLAGRITIACKLREGWAV